MVVRRIEVYEAYLEYKEPFTISLGTSVSSTDLIVKVFDEEENFGLGETSPAMRIVGESTKTMEAAVAELAPSLIGLEVSRIGIVEETMDRITLGNSGAKLALEMAILDLMCRKSGLPLWRMLGGYRDEVETDITIGIKKPDEIAKDAVRYVENGFKILKLKVGVDSVEDIERVSSVRDAVGSDIRIRVDANQGWSVKQAVRCLNEMYRYDVELAEQPVKWFDLEGLAEVRAASPIPVMADESVRSPRNALRVVEMRAADYVNIKLVKSGGLLKAMKIASICEAAGVPNMVGCMMEGGVSIAAAVHLAAGVKNIVTTDLDSDLSLVRDVVVEGGSPCMNGRRRPPEGPGLGNLRLDDEMLKPVMVFGD